MKDDQHDLDAPPTRENDAKTSNRAARILAYTLNGVRGQVNEVLRANPAGLTQSQTRLLCEEKYGLRAESTYRRRLLELAEMGLARRTEQTRLNPLGNQECVWVPIIEDE
jgi:hypothetical protein